MTILGQSIVFKNSIPTANEWIAANNRHRMVAAKLKKKTEQNLCLEMRVANAKPVTTYPVNLVYRWFCKNKRTDKSNIIFGQKFVEDALQKGGILRNDGWSEIGDITHLFYIDGNDPCLILDIQEQR